MSTVESLIAGKKMKPVGVTPAIALVNPKFPMNVGNVVRLASCYGIKQVWFSGDRVSLTPTKKYRLPREERMKGYKDVQLRQHDYFLEHFNRGVTPVCIELRDSSECLYDFEHPEHALYIFGPEDGSVPKVIAQHCHRFLVIPTRHCLNLNNAVHAVLQDRSFKHYMNTGEKEELNEQRGWADSDTDKEIGVYR